MVGSFDFQQYLDWFLQIDQWLENTIIQYGYLGIFFVSLFGASSIIFPIPYTVILFSIGSFRILDPFLIAISGGAGSALGEFLGYFLGYFGRSVISEVQQKKMNRILELFGKYGTATIFLFALTPLPDDLLFIPLGIMRYSLLKAFIPSLLGKMLMCFILAYGGHASFTLIENILGGRSGYITTIASAVLLIVILIVMIKIDWEKYLPLEKEDDKKT